MGGTQGDGVGVMSLAKAPQQFLHYFWENGARPLGMGEEYSKWNEEYSVQTVGYVLGTN